MGEFANDIALWAWLAPAVFGFGLLLYDLHLERKCDRLQDKVDGLEADLDNAIETAFNRGAHEWVKLNYPTHYVRLRQANGVPLDPKEFAEYLMREDKPIMDYLAQSEANDKAPWSQEKVDMLNARQMAGDVHPYTCPGDYPQCANHRELIATPDGWVCVCGKYKQSWAH